MPKRSGHAVWKGNLAEGTGALGTSSNTLKDHPYNFPSRYADGGGTNPEELLATAHAGCYAMALTHLLSEGGHEPKSVVAKATVTLGERDNKPTITTIELECSADVPNITKEDFDSIANKAKEGCPVSRALAGTEISLHAQLTN